MITKKPSDFQPALRDEYLALIAKWLLEEWYATEDDLVRETDNPYTRGTTRFGRQLQRIVNEYTSRRHNWLGLENGGALDLVFSIGGVPCRFSNDNIQAPTKRAVLEVHPYQMVLIEDAEPGAAVRFCFVVDQGIEGSMEPYVELLGFSASGNVACRWKSAAQVRTLVAINAAPSEPVEIRKPEVTPKKGDQDSAGKSSTAQGDESTPSE